MTTTTMGTTRTEFYQHNSPGTYGGLGKDPLMEHLTKAYKLAGLEPPALLADIDEALAAELTEQEAVAKAAQGASDATDAQEWLVQSLESIARARAADALKKSYHNERNKIIRGQHPALVEQATKDLAPCFDKVSEALCKAAKALPEGNPLDADTVFATDTTVDYKQAISCLSALGVLASLWADNGCGVGRNASKALIVVRVPECLRPLRVNRLSHAPLEPIEPARAQVREFAQCATKEGIDVALVRVARGDWDSLELALPTESYSTRLGWAENAVSSVAVDSW